ncbi:MAG TPA: transglutaminase family protein [Albitalea sp.]|uniref:transglutaminase family protein n=1 Tax=Piscinibacter sp. TaxID=1903157 RepID=UPI002ED10817
MKLDIQHETHYEYSAPLRYSTQSLRLTPQPSAHQTVLRWALQVPGKLFAQRDGYGNEAHTWTLARRLWRGAIHAAGLVETHASPWLVDAPALPSPLLYLRPTALTPFDRQLLNIGAQALDGAPAERNLLALARLVRERVAYRHGVTDVMTSAVDALDIGAGVCQDQAHVFIAACRARGVPARYVSGYFYAPDSPALASHAWADVCIDIPGRLWLSVDVTHGCVMDDRHVRLAVGPDYAACLPIRGVRHGGGEEAMRVSVQIRPAAP